MSVSDAVTAGLHTARELVGLSGARVLLASRDGRKFFVRKIARSAADSERLETQAKKQRAFAATGAPLKVPTILDEGRVDGVYWFDMEYVRGVDGASVLRAGAFADITRFSDKLCAYLKHASVVGAVVSKPAALFDSLYGRVAQAEKRTGALGPSRLGRILLGLDRVRACGTIASTLCHGDLTLENIVVDADGALWAIDLLDAPFEHWWLDVAKLHQDLQGGWYLRTQSNIALGAVEHVSRKILAAAEELTPGYGAIHDVLVATTFARVLPYARGDAERAFVLERVDHFAARCT